jgi:predicted RNase H-like HicB family nuclease
MRYAIIIERAKENYYAYAPDLPGCAATGTTIEEVEEQRKEAIAFHIEGMREEGLEIPKPVTLCGYLETKVDVKI